MTLVFSAATSALMSGSFGVNEVASAITVGRYVGSIFSRRQDAKILDLVSELNKLEIQEAPDWLTTVRFTRRATIHGERMRRVTAYNVLNDLDMGSVDGVATFIALILRYVQTPESTAGIIAQLLRGRFGILTCASGYVETPLPYSMKGNIVKFVQSVWESDKDSVQNGDCLQWLSELTSYVGKSHDARTHSSYSLAEQERFIGVLLAARMTTHRFPVTFHTLSASVAIVALAARAQGAQVQLECVVRTEDGGVEAKQLPIASSHPASLIVKLWLVQPPPDLHNKVPGLDKFRQASNQNTMPTVVIYGGAAEISLFVSRQISKELLLEPSRCLRIWEEGFAIGEKAVWYSVPSSRKRSAIQLDETFFSTDFQEAKAAEALFSIAVEKFRTRLVKKAFLAVHRALHRRKYGETQEVTAIIQLALTAIIVGCIRSQILDRTHENSLQSFAWATDVPIEDLPRYLGFQTVDYPHYPDVGISSTQLLTLAGSIWGGSSFKTREIGLDPDTVGFICPHGTFLLDLVRNPEDFIEQVTRGRVGYLISLFKGSVPLLPPCSSDGSIIGGTASASKSRVVLDSFYRVSYEKGHSSCKSLPPILTLEAMSTDPSNLSLILCAWVHGEVLAELNPAMIFANLLAKLPASDRKKSLGWFQKPKKCVEIPCEMLTKSKYFRPEDKDPFLVIRTEPQWEWRVLIAGLASPCNIIETRHLSPKFRESYIREVISTCDKEDRLSGKSADGDPLPWIVLQDKTD